MFKRKKLRRQKNHLFLQPMPNGVTPYLDTRTKKAQVEEMFDNVAHRYDFLNHLLSAGIDTLWRKKAVSFLQKTNPKILMDMATGTGDFAFELMALKPEKIVGYDLSEKMLEIGRIKNVKKGTENTIDFIKGDSENIPFPDNSFDGITAGFGVRNFENLHKGLSEMLRILKSGAYVVILEPTNPTIFPVKQIFNLYFNHVAPLIGRLLSKDHRAYTYLPESVAAFPQGADFVNILQQVGYTNVKHTPLTLGICGMYTAQKA